MPLFKNIFKKIGDTIQGKTKLGKGLHEILPAKKLRSAVGSAVLGIKKASPLPEFKEGAVKESITSAAKAIDSSNTEGMDSQQLLGLIRQVRDILDDGKMNDSPDDLSPKLKKLITQAFSALPILLYVIYGITTGEWNLGDFLNYLGSFLGIG